MGATAINSKRVKRQKLDAYVETYPDGTRQIIIEGEPLMGRAELADALGVLVQNIYHVSGLPEAAGKIRASPIWLGHEVHAFAAFRRARKAAGGR